MIMKKFWALNRSLSAFQFCVPTLHVGVLLRRNSFCINAMDYHVVSFAESHLIRERNSDVESLSARQGRSFSLPLCHRPASL